MSSSTGQERLSQILLLYIENKLLQNMLEHPCFYDEVIDEIQVIDESNYITSPEVFKNCLSYLKFHRTFLYRFSFESSAKLPPSEQQTRLFVSLVLDGVS